jgi:TRAP-type C4-dicarboxylate transport system substrate-binding protein
VSKVHIRQHQPQLFQPRLHRRAFLAAAGACAISAPAILRAQAAAQYTLRLASWGAPKAPQVVEFIGAFQQEIETASGGRIAVQSFPAGSL